MNPEEGKNVPKEEPDFTRSYEWVRLHGDEEDHKRWRAENRRHTEWLIESEAQRYVREGFCTDIEQARRESREATWPFA